ncbi:MULTISPECIES: hypothetical protein [unclassified Luteococcus]|uniref:hypothetical protein n=1 Tax=unclassified Luteococcus TaxID=2639923 RepID=UPI00313A9746
MKIKQTTPTSYVITLPEFIFIGHDKEEFKLAVEKNGILSWVSPDVDTADLITEVLGADAQQEQISRNRQALEEQARAFYVGIVKGVQPDATVELRFSPSA